MFKKRHKCVWWERGKGERGGDGGEREEEGKEWEKREEIIHKEW